MYPPFYISGKGYQTTPLLALWPPVSSQHFLWNEVQPGLTYYYEKRKASVASTVYSVAVGTVIQCPHVHLHVKTRLHAIAVLLVAGRDSCRPPPSPRFMATECQTWTWNLLSHPCFNGRSSCSSSEDAPDSGSEPLSHYTGMDQVTVFTIMIAIIVYADIWSVTITFKGRILNSEGWDSLNYD